MMVVSTFLRKYSGILLILVLTLIPIFLWLPGVINNFSLRSVGQALSLTGTILLSTNFILSTRLRWVESLFNGLNYVYINHHLIGIYSFMFLLFHPVFIGLFYLKISLRSAFDILFPPITEYATWFGMAALITMITFMVITLYIKLPYEIWKFTHKFMGITLFLATLHIYFIDSSISTNMPLRLYVLGFCFIGLSAYVYRTLLGRLTSKKYPFKVSGVKINKDVIEIEFTPEKEKFVYLPGQFVFVRLNSLGITSEDHPFSLTSDPTETTLSVSAKSVGNYTETLKLLKIGASAQIEGPFGGFSYLSKTRKKQIWIAGGIGVTPFLSMAKSLLRHPDYKIIFYYVVGTQEEAIYLSKFMEIAEKNQNFKLTPVFTKTQGRLTADVVKKFTNDLPERDILICGPPPMMKSLRDQFNKLGVRNFHIFSEEFSLD